MDTAEAIKINLNDSLAALVLFADIRFSLTKYTNMNSLIIYNLKK